MGRGSSQDSQDYRAVIPDQARNEAVGAVWDGLSRLGSRHLLDTQFLSSSTRFSSFSH
ncbi:hypothetical protein FA13DRAFT_1734350 [Coprinellus micaceus]|uniref:Uncharacterized protein n=1 Tax=Coprinellus micaceus TaxID=71717 RepID=A0A4Y7T7B4_COPMI|nr:hypothetical protein FA13DRAFT_1734350 [Coprinellus micaceus]